MVMTAALPRGRLSHLWRDQGPGLRPAAPACRVDREIRAGIGAGPRRPALPRSDQGGGRCRRGERRFSRRRPRVASLREPAGRGRPGRRRALAPRASPGVMLAPEIAVATSLTQGCMPIGPMHRIDEARDNIVMVIDGRPALSVFLEDIGPDLAQDLRRLGGVIFAGLPVAGSDTGDYLVRNIMAIDPGRGWVVRRRRDRRRRPDPVLPARPGERAARHGADGAPARRPARRAAQGRDLRQLRRARRQLCSASPESRPG